MWREWERKVTVWQFITKAFSGVGWLYAKSTGDAVLLFETLNPENPKSPKSPKPCSTFQSHLRLICVETRLHQLCKTPSAAHPPPIEPVHHGSGRFSSCILEPVIQKKDVSFPTIMFGS